MGISQYIELYQHASASLFQCTFHGNLLKRNIYAMLGKLNTYNIKLINITLNQI